jgi:hypothetical protein
VWAHDQAARHAGHPHQALELAQAAICLVGDADKVLQAALRMSIAFAHDSLGQARAALRALDVGQQLLDDPRLAPSPWSGMDPARFMGMRGLTEAVCGRLEHATASLRIGIDACPAGNGHRGVLLAPLARVRFAQEDPEQAAQHASEADPTKRAGCADDGGFLCPSGHQGAPAADHADVAALRALRTADRD